ncbi:MAG TPA: NAD(P)H-quinone oxidoreductase [Actinomycetes bacterium]|nr:NAD(P)H-quinone oxidoreductase [Actinomycetes bacterium]
MRAIVVDHPGPPDVLRWGEAPDPVAAAGEVLVAVAAAGVNRADLLQREGHYPPPAGASPTLGLECSGRVVAVGPAVSGWAIGDEVCALLTGGGYAELAPVPQGQLMPVPQTIDLVSAAALPEAAATVWSNLFMVAGLRPGERLLVHGGGSGIGTMAVQLAKAVGAQVFATVGSAAKADAVRGLGAEATINYRDEDFVERVRDLTGGAGVDVVLDVIGAKYLQRNLAALATGGRIVVIGLQGGTRAELDLGRLLGKRAAIVGTTLRSRPEAEKAEIVRQVVEHVWPLLEQGVVRPVVDRVVAIQDAADAHRAMAAGENVGKIVLAVDRP